MALPNIAFVSCRPRFLITISSVLNQRGYQGESLLRWHLVFLASQDNWPALFIDADHPTSSHQKMGPNKVANGDIL